MRNIVFHRGDCNYLVTQKKHIPSEEKNSLHPRNKNNTRYDFPSLIKTYPELERFVFKNKYHHRTINFADPEGVRMLNKVLLNHFYGITSWEIPKDYLCPPIPGRADYIHYIADLLGSCNENIIPQGKTITALDIGVGASCIYPIIGNNEYGWRFVCSETDLAAIASAQDIIQSNRFPDGSIEVRLQNVKEQIFRGIIRSNENYDFTICNPPFHSSIDQASAGTRRKWKNILSKNKHSTVLNFGGKSNELVFPGGEEAFISTMITESAEFAKQVFWFTTLVSKQSNLSKLYQLLATVNPIEVRTIKMAQGQKISRFIAWTFLLKEEQKSWQQEKWVFQKINSK